MNSLHWYFSNRAHKQKIACATVRRYYDMASPARCTLHGLQYSLRYKNKKKINKSQSTRKTDTKNEDEMFFISRRFRVFELPRYSDVEIVWIVLNLHCNCTRDRWELTGQFWIWIVGPDDGSAFCTRRWWYLADVSYTAPFSDETTCRWLSIKRMHTPPLTDPFPPPPPVLVLLFSLLEYALVFFFFFFFLSRTLDIWLRRLLRPVTNLRSSVSRYMTKSIDFIMYN